MPRSAASVAWAICQPAFAGPTRFSVGMKTSSRKISQKCDSPVAWRMGRTSRPGERMSSRKYEMPGRLGASGSLRARSRHQSAWSAPLTHTFWPDHQVAAVGRHGGAAQAGQVRAGLGLGEALAPDLAVEDGGQVPLLLLGRAADQQRGRGVVDRDERQHQAGRVVRGQLLVEHDLLGGGHAAAPLGRPVRHGEPGGAELLEPRLLELDERVVGHAGLGGAPVGGDVGAAPVADAAAELLEIAHRTHPSAAAENKPARPCRPRSRVELVGGGSPPEREAAQRLAGPGQPRQEGLVAEPDGAVELVGDAEDHLGGLDGGQAQRERVLDASGRPTWTLQRA